MKTVTYDVESSLKGYAEDEWGPCGYDRLETVSSARNVISNLRGGTHKYRIVKVTREVVK